MQYHYMTVELISWIQDLDQINLWMNHSVCSCELDQRIDRKNQTQENDSFINQTSLFLSPTVMNASIEWTPILSCSHKTIIKRHHKTWNMVWSDNIHFWVNCSFTLIVKIGTNILHWSVGVWGNKKSAKHSCNQYFLVLFSFHTGKKLYLVQSISILSNVCLKQQTKSGNRVRKIQFI